MEYVYIALSVAACFVSWCIGVRMGAVYAVKRIVDEV